MLPLWGYGQNHLTFMGHPITGDTYFQDRSAILLKEVRQQNIDKLKSYRQCDKKIKGDNSLPKIN